MILERHKEALLHLYEIASIVSGTPQFRIVESLDSTAPTYQIYSQSNLADDLAGVTSHETNQKFVRTFDEVEITEEDNLLYSLISGKAARVGRSHEGFLLTQNYVMLKPKKQCDALFLIYLLNEDQQVKKQLHKGLQGSIVQKYTLKQLKSLILPQLPSLQKQRLIGETYANLLKLQVLKKRTAQLHQLYQLAQLRKVYLDVRE